MDIFWNYTLPSKFVELLFFETDLKAILTKRYIMAMLLKLLVIPCSYMMLQNLETKELDSFITDGNKI